MGMVGREGMGLDIGRRNVHPSLGPISFIFTQLLRKNGQTNRLVPPPSALALPGLRKSRICHTFEAEGGVHLIQRSSVFSSDRMKSTQAVQVVQYEKKY